MAADGLAIVGAFESNAPAGIAGRLASTRRATGTRRSRSWVSNSGAETASSRATRSGWRRANSAASSAPSPWPMKAALGSAICAMKSSSSAI